MIILNFKEILEIIKYFILFLKWLKKLLFKDRHEDFPMEVQ